MREKRRGPWPSVLLVEAMYSKIKDTFTQDQFDIYEHAFEIQMPKRSYLFYTETEIEAKRWVRVLSLLVSMRQAGLNLKRSGINPFDYENYLVSKQILSKIERYDTERNEDPKQQMSLSDQKPLIELGNPKTTETKEIVTAQPEKANKPSLQKFKTLEYSPRIRVVQT